MQNTVNEYETVYNYLTPQELTDLGLGYLVPLEASDDHYIDVDEIFGN